jgi:hypothetical protein
VTIGDYIKQCFSSFGDISDAGVEKFALELGLNPSSDADLNNKKIVSESINKFMNKILVHPTSVSENGHSKSWGVDSLENYAKYMFKLYGIIPDDSTAALVGLSVIKDASNLW